MMTLERASELVMAAHSANREAGWDLFAHFCDYFNLHEFHEINPFAEMCGFAVATRVLKDE